MTVISVNSLSTFGGEVTLNLDMNGNPDGTATYDNAVQDSGGSGGSGGGGSSGGVGTGWDSFSYQISDTAANTTSGTAWIYVKPNYPPDFNAPPFARPDTATTQEDTPITITNALANDWDDNGSLTIVDAFSELPGAVVTHDGSTIIYTPPENWHGTDTVRYAIQDSMGQFNSNSGGFIEIEVESVNDEPQVVVNEAWTGWKETINVSVLNESTDEDGDQLIVTNASGALKGHVCFNGVNVTYTPFDDFYQGTDTFTYEVKDGHGGTVSKTVTVTMVEVTDWTVEWIDADDQWNVSPAGEAVWSHETLRSQAFYGPTPPTGPTNIYWIAQDWTDFENDVEHDDSSPFAGAPYDELNEELFAIGNPGVGIWAILPHIGFRPDNQSAFVAQMDKPDVLAKGELDDMKVVSIEWDETKNPNLDAVGNPDKTADGTRDLGGGSSIIPDKNSPTEQDNREVFIKIGVKPAVLGIRVSLLGVDADDPSDNDGPIDNDMDGTPTQELTDNRGTMNVVAQAQTTVIDNNTAYAWESFDVSLFPGDNLRIVAATRTTWLNRIKPLVPDTKGRMIFDTNNNDQYDIGEQIFDETNPITGAVPNKTATNVFHSSPLLTVWRRLNVEVDSMGAPNPNIVFDVDDPDPGDVSDPNIGAFHDAFDHAYILPVIMIDESAGGPSERDTPFIKEFSSAIALQNEATAERGSTEEALYWSVHVFGIYELGSFQLTFNDNCNNQQQVVNVSTLDNDAQTEFGLLGFTLGGGPETSFIIMEVLRDVAAQHGWNAQQIQLVNQIVTLHEVGHQFGLVHECAFPGTGVMAAPNNGDASEPQIPNMTAKFIESDIKIIRNIPSPPDLKP